MLVVANDVGGRTVRHPLSLGRGLDVGEITLHQIIERDAKKLTDLDELVHLGVALLGLPLCDRLTGDTEQHGELLLGHVSGGTKVLEVVAEAHSVLL